MSFSYQVILSDPTNAGGANDAILVYDLQQALGVWSLYISGLGTLVVSLNIQDTKANNFAAAPTTSSLVSTTNGFNIFQPSSLYELTTGKHVNGSTSDITINVDLGSFKVLDLAPNLTYTSQVADNKENPIIGFLHELGHGFGMYGFYNQKGVLSDPGTDKSTFDTFIQFSKGGAFFIGKNAEAAFGGPVPLTTTSTTQNYYHFGNTQSDAGKTPATVQDPLTLDLMNGIAFFANYQYKISPLDLAVLKDIGFKVNATDVLAVSSVSATTESHTTHATTGQTITVSVGFNEAVVISGAPTLQLSDNEVATYQTGSGTDTLKFNYVVQASDHTSDLQVSGINLSAESNVHDTFGNVLSNVSGDLGLQINEIANATIQDDYLAITRTTLSLAQATTIANDIVAGKQTESAFVSSLFPQVANTTIPAVAIEGSMYNAVGTSNEITLLSTQFLPPQVADAISHGFNPQVYASEALGLVFAFNNETDGTGFANNFGPSHAGTPNTIAGDAAFAAAASIAIFDTASTPVLVTAIQGYVANWKAFYTDNGLPGIAQPSADQVDRPSDQLS